MAGNNFDSNFTRKLAKTFITGFESYRVLSKNVNTQLLDGKFAPDTGGTVDFKRPTDYKSTRTATGDVSGSAPSEIITGKASGIVQDYFTVEVDYDEADEAIKMDQLDQLLNPAARRIVTDMEVDYAGFMMRNTALLSGSVGTPVSSWNDVALAGATMSSTGIPMDDQWCYTVNPYTQTSLASDQRSLGAGGSAGGMISEAHRKAVMTDDFAGMRVLAATTLDSYSTFTSVDRAGTLSANPDVSYLTAKDTMRQTIAVTAMGANMVIKAGETITITGVNRLNLSTRKPIIDASGNTVEFSATVNQDVILDGAGAGNIIITGPAIYEANGSYNTVDRAPIATDIVTLGGANSTLIQPNLFWHKQAFSIGSVPIKKLYSTDTTATTADGLQIRVSKGASIRENKQIVRFDMRPAYSVLNPFFAGQSFG